jgi:hypothetical protein
MKKLESFETMTGDKIGVSFFGASEAWLQMFV